MKKTLTLVLAAAVVAVASVSYAQGGGRGQGGGRMGMFGGQRNSGFGLLNRKDVQTDLKMTAEQVKAVEEAQTAMREEMRNAFQGGGGGGDREAMQKMMEDMQKKQNEKMSKILDANQQNRLKQIGWQLQGNRAIMDPELQKVLGLSDDVVSKIKALQTKQQEANRAIMEKVQNGEIERDQLQELRQKNDKILDEELAKLLTDENKANLKTKLGEPFKADPNQNQGGRRPPPAN